MTPNSEASGLTDWIPLTEREPEHGALVEVMSTSWSSPRWLVFDAIARRLRDVSSGLHFWYPERMKWRPSAHESKRPPATSAEAVAMEWVKAVQEAYGWLWNINNEPLAPIPMLPEGKAAYQARKPLRDLLTTEQRGEAINAVRATLENMGALCGCRAGECESKPSGCRMAREVAPPTTVAAGEAHPEVFEGGQVVPCCVQMDPAHPQSGWLFIPHADGNWVSLCKLPAFSARIIEYWLAEQTQPPSAPPTDPKADLLRRMADGLERLANAADDVGVKRFDSDDLPADVQAMRDATSDARAIIWEARK